MTRDPVTVRMTSAGMPEMSMARVASPEVPSAKAVLFRHFRHLATTESTASELLRRVAAAKEPVRTMAAVITI